MAIEIGQQAPAFTVYDSEKNKISLSDYKGNNVVLLFFPLAFTSVCTKELCAVRDDIATYNDANARVLGISVDSLYVLNKYKTEQHINFPLLSDFNKVIAKAYDVLYETFPPFDMHGVSKRAAFIIDREGIVRYAEVCAKPSDLPDFNAIHTITSSLNSGKNVKN